MTKKKLDHDVLLRWRTQLTDLEVDTLIPLFKGRLEGFVDIFERMLVALNRVRADPVYLNAVEAVVNPGSLPTSPSYVRGGLNYCNEIERIIKDDFLKRISDLQVDLASAKDFRTFSKFINLLDQLCASVNQNKANLFLMSVKPYAHMIDHASRTILTTPPVEYLLILRPFDVWLENLEQIAKGTSGTIETWRKTQTDWKTQYLLFRANEESSRNSSLVLKINIATVFVAVSVSLVFLFFPDLLGLKKENIDLKTEVQTLKTNLSSVYKELNELKQLALKSKGIQKR